MHMNKKKTDHIGKRFMITGLLLIAAALLLVLYNVWDANRAQKASAAIVEKLDTVISENGQGLLEYMDPNQEMPTEEIDGYWYIGILDIPSLGLELPVMADWDYERLKISPCRYSGSYYADDMVICAHNYAKHFSPIKWIDVGADVYFTSVNGQVYHYQVSNRESVLPSNVEDMIANVENEWDMTLFTCNTGGRTRCAVRCVRMQ